MQSKQYDEREGRKMLIRIIGEEAADTFKVKTVYKTSNIEKYWKTEGA